MNPHFFLANLIGIASVSLGRTIGIGIVRPRRAGLDGDSTGLAAMLERETCYLFHSWLRTIYEGWRLILCLRIDKNDGDGFALASTFGVEKV